MHSLKEGYELMAVLNALCHANILKRENVEYIIYEWHNGNNIPLENLIKNESIPKGLVTRIRIYIKND